MVQAAHACPRRPASFVNEPLFKGKGSQKEREAEDNEGGNGDASLELKAVHTGDQGRVWGKCRAPSPCGK